MYSLDDDKRYEILSSESVNTPYGQKRTLLIKLNDETSTRVYLPASFLCPVGNLVGQMLKKTTLSVAEYLAPCYGTTYLLDIEPKYYL